MRNITSAFKEQLNNDNRKYLEWIDITLKDGTVLNLRESDVWGYGLKVEDAVSDSSEFKIGSAIVNKATVTLNNIYDDFSNYDFEGATVVCYVGLRISPSGLEFPKDVPWLDVNGNTILDIDGNEIYIKYDDAEIERIRLCTMTVVDAPYQNSSILTLTCQDNMMKFDKDYSESKLQYPATRSEIIRDACKVCGVSLQTVTFANDDSDWIKAVKYTDDTAVDNLNKLLTQEEIFNRLTNNGEVQGIYSQDGQYITEMSHNRVAKQLEKNGTNIQRVQILTIQTNSWYWIRLQKPTKGHYFRSWQIMY